MGEVAWRSTRCRDGVAAEPELAVALAREPSDVAERKRWPSTGGRGESVSRCAEGDAVAESDRVVGFTGAGEIQRSVRSQDDGAVRLRSTFVLVRGYEAWRCVQLQYGNEPGTGDSTSELAGEIHSGGPTLADERDVEFSRGQRRVQGFAYLQRGNERHVWRAEEPGGLRAEVAGDGLRRRARDVRGICTQQVHV